MREQRDRKLSTVANYVSLSATELECPFANTVAKMCERSVRGLWSGNTTAE
jgi:hypothetical protein